MEQLASSSISSEVQVSNEKYFLLSDGRQLAYTEQGDTDSNKIIIFFHGAFCVGDCSNENDCYQEIEYHFIMPTLPGWGNSSSWPKNQPISNYPNDVHQLLSSLKKNNNKNLRIVVAGGSYGSVYAQICFSTSTDIMPEVTHVQSLIVLSGFSPFKYHKKHTDGMSWSSYFAIGSPSIHFPFISKLVGSLIRKKVRNIEEVKKFVRKKFFDKMGDDEKVNLRKWEEDNNKSAEWAIDMMSRNIYLSISKTMAGFNEMPRVLHSDWGFDPKKLSSSPSKRKVLIVATQGDEISHMEMSTYLVESYPNAELKIISGGHLGTFFEFDSIMKTWLTDIDKDDTEKLQLNEQASCS
ncbi:unnamed protein product [Rotaria socialis]|uniref:AB hydrolase-1 domain-containing protein n=2 Tax=Rotaria socialis TaxID=392032 RepID=A0A820LDQ4_9BILA|nr:unnamed protein product [Rotaria socialis]CAF3282598.1 unnamed protein product [Rotaria socialis]CAF3435256.1 unnamed protein product [Rotaria socialis]CAF3615721.1 unnamed protein product [Rotaria socialis]CAF4272667.1 unnamed protein product [Rotaria socialis]